MAMRPKAGEPLGESVERCEPDLDSRLLLIDRKNNPITRLWSVNADEDNKNIACVIPLETDCPSAPEAPSWSLASPFLRPQQLPSQPRPGGCPRGSAAPG